MSAPVKVVWTDSPIGNGDRRLAWVYVGLEFCGVLAVSTDNAPRLQEGFDGACDVTNWEHWSQAGSNV